MQPVITFRRIPVVSDVQVFSCLILSSLMIDDRIVKRIVNKTFDYYHPFLFKFRLKTFLD